MAEVSTVNEEGSSQESSKTPSIENSNKPPLTEKVQYWLGELRKKLPGNSREVIEEVAEPPENIHSDKSRADVKERMENIAEPVAQVPTQNTSIKEKMAPPPRRGLEFYLEHMGVNKDFFEGKQIANLGAGGDDLEKELSEAGVNTSVVNLDLKYPRSFLGKQMSNPKKAIAADMLNTPLASDSMDLVISSEAMSRWLPKSKQPEAYNEALRVLKPGGELYVFRHSFPQSENPNKIIQHIKESYPGIDIKYDKKRSVIRIVKPTAVEVEEANKGAMKANEGVSNGESKPSRYYRLLREAGITRLTPEELSWIRQPEIVPAENVMDTRDLVGRFREVCARKVPEIEEKSLGGYGMPYTVFDVVRLASVFSDKDNDYIESDILPSSQMVQEFIDFISESNHPVDVVEQFEKLLEISNGKVINASLVGMMSSRIVARNLDIKAYPDIVIDEHTRDRWNNNLMAFTLSDKPQDKLGDNYYFWTSVFTSLALEKTEANWFVKAMDKHSAKIMTMSRRLAARQPTITDHSEAFSLGKKLSDFMASYLDKKDVRTSKTEANDFQMEISSSELMELDEMRRVDLISEEITKLQEDQGLLIRNDVDAKVLEEGFDLVEYFSALPIIGRIHSNRDMDWRDVINEVRAKHPYVSVTKQEEGVLIKKRPHREIYNSNEVGPDREWLESKLGELGEEPRRYAEKLILAGMSGRSSDIILYEGEEVSIYKLASWFESLTQNAEFRETYFTKDEWKILTEVIESCVDSGQALIDSTSSQPETNFMVANKELVLHSLIFPKDGISPRLNKRLLSAVESFDASKASTDDKLDVFIRSLTTQSWLDKHEENLEKLDGGEYTVSVLYLTQNVFELLSEGGEKRKGVVQKTLTRLLSEAVSGDIERKNNALEKLEAIYNIGLDYESDPILSAFATMHDPSLYATAKYYLERPSVKDRILQILRPLSSVRSVEYARNIVNLLERTPQDLLDHQSSLSRRLSCPSCYGYAGGLEVQQVIQGGSTGVNAYTPPDKMVKFSEDLSSWASEKSKR